jgi:hypothetical protein
VPLELAPGRFAVSIGGDFSGAVGRDDVNIGGERFPPPGRLLVNNGGGLVPEEAAADSRLLWMSGGRRMFELPLVGVAEFGRFTTSTGGRRSELPLPRNAERPAIRLVVARGSDVATDGRGASVAGPNPKIGEFQGNPPCNLFATIVPRGNVNPDRSLRLLRAAKIRLIASLVDITFLRPLVSLRAANHKRAELTPHSNGSSYHSARRPARLWRWSASRSDVTRAGEEPEKDQRVQQSILAVLRRSLWPKPNGCGQSSLSPARPNSEADFDVEAEVCSDFLREAKPLPDVHSKCRGLKSKVNANTAADEDGIKVPVWSGAGI